MKRMLSILVGITLIIALVPASAGCIPELAPAPSPTPTPAPTPAPTIEEANFRFLISDEENDIQDFEHLYVTISEIGVQQGGESGEWILLEPDSDPDGDDIPGIDLRPLEEDNALLLWSGNLTAGEYTKVFIHVSDVSGVLIETGELVDVKLPSEKLQISKPFEVKTDSVTSFVFDVTVVAAGSEQSGIKYILKPVVQESGSDQKFERVKTKEKQLPPGRTSFPPGQGGNR